MTFEAKFLKKFEEIQINQNIDCKTDAKYKPPYPEL